MIDLFKGVLNLYLRVRAQKIISEHFFWVFITLSSWYQGKSLCKSTRSLVALHFFNDVSAGVVKQYVVVVKHGPHFYCTCVDVKSLYLK